MPRTKEFEPQEALDRAVDLFWRKGYSATSMRDLLEVMCIGRGSFYGTFGDKHALFLAALDRFEERRTTWILDTLEGAGVEGIEEVFRRTVENLVRFEPRRGCLLANTATELAPHDAQVAAKISGHLRKMEKAFENALLRARDAGEIPSDRDPLALAWFLVAHLQGMRVLARAGTDRGTLEDAVRVALGALR